MDASNFYRDPDPELCQGDILYSIPHLHLKPPFQALRSTTGRGGQQVFTPYPFDISALFAHGDHSEPPGGFKFDRGEQVSSFCQVSLGIILTHDCDIDQDPKHRLVALIRPLDPRQPAQDQQVIRENRNFNFFYLPPYRDKMQESYVDFRRITCLAPEFLDKKRRVTSLTKFAIDQLHLRLFQFLTRRDLIPSELEGSGTTDGD